jgi:hypothetical protein
VEVRDNDTWRRTLAEISRKEKEKAIRSENYEDALVVGFLEGLFLEVEKSL